MSSEHPDQDSAVPSTVNRRRFLGMTAAAGTAAGLPGLIPAPAGADPAGADPAGQPARTRPVTGRAAPGRRGYPMTAQALGVNTTSGDRNFADAEVPGLLAAAHMGLIRYPGGSGADTVNWMSPTLALPWPAFMALLDRIGAAPMITINYGTLAQGPDSAAAWVGSALTFDTYDSRTAVWVIGNEGYGPWERDQHPDPHTPASYAMNVRPYFEAMHAVDPGTRVSFPMTIDRAVAAGTGTWVADPDRWNHTVLAHNADQVDVIDFHWYPVFGIPVLSNAELFATVDRIPGAMRYLRSVIDAYAPDIPIVISESNVSQSEIVYNCQPVAALYAVATALTWLSQGAESYMWWQVHNNDTMNGDFGFLSNGTGSPGPSETTSTAPAPAGARHLEVADPAGFHYAHQFTVDSGAGPESRKITAIGGPATLAAAVAAGDTRLAVSTVVPFAPGTPVRIDVGASQETGTVETVGTAAASGILAASAAPGDTTLRIVGTPMGGQSIPVFMPTGFAPGAVLTVGTGPDAETATVASVGTSSSLGTTLAAPASAGDTTVYVASVANSDTGIAHYVGDPLTVDAGAAQELRTITAVGSSAAAPTGTVAPLTAGARTVYLADVAGVTVGHPLMLDTGDRREIVASIASVGAQAVTTLAAAATAGATNVKVAGVAGLLAGHPLTIGTGADRETAVIRSVGGAGADGSGVTLSGPLTLDHARDAAVRDVGTGVILSRPVAADHPAGVAAVDLGSGITLSAPLQRSHAVGAPTRDAGTGLTLTAALRAGHADGAPVTTPGTGITVSAPIAAAHPAGAPIVSTGITFTPALGAAHPAGAVLRELGLRTPPLNTPMPAYWGFVLAALMTGPGAQLRELTPAGTRVRAYASYRSGTESICLINTDDVDPVTVQVDGFRADGALTTHGYGLLHPAVVEGTVAARTVRDGLVLAAESITVLVGPAGTAAPRVTVPAPR